MKKALVEASDTESVSSRLGDPGVLQGLLVNLLSFTKTVSGQKTELGGTQMLSLPPRAVFYINTSRI